MKVHELISLLKSCDKEFDVFIESNDIESTPEKAKSISENEILKIVKINAFGDYK